MLKVSCISSLKWQLNDSMTNRMHLGVQTSAPTLGPGRVWERKKTLWENKHNTQNYSSVHESAAKLYRFPCVSREMQNVVTL